MSAAIDRERLAQLLGMFSSDFDNEIVTAARMAERLRKRSGMTWDDILNPVPFPELTRERPIENLSDALAHCLYRAESLSEWEFSFVTSLRRQRSAATPKQIAVVEGIVGKLRRAEARAAA